MRIGFNGNQLKLIAVVSMLVDHMAYLFIGVGMLTPALQAGEEVPALFLLYRVLRAIGRMAFPVFCFLLVEGFLHTKSRRRYAIRLGIFSLISEIPFDLLTSGTRLFVDWSSQNVMITLFLGLLMMEVLERLDIRKKNILDQGRNYSSENFLDISLYKPIYQRKHRHVHWIKEITCIFAFPFPPRPIIKKDENKRQDKCW